MPEKRRLNLDDHQPDDIEIIFRGSTYDIPGEIPVPAIVRMLRIKTRIEAAGGDIDVLADEVEGLVESGDALRPGIMELIRVRQPDAPTLPLGVGDVVTIIEFLVASFGVDDTITDATPPDDELDAEDRGPLVTANSTKA